jgi:hypothetical protein
MERKRETKRGIRTRNSKIIRMSYWVANKGIRRENRSETYCMKEKKTKTTNKVKNAMIVKQKRIASCEIKPFVYELKRSHKYRRWNSLGEFIN